MVKLALQGDTRDGHIPVGAGSPQGAGGAIASVKEPLGQGNRDLTSGAPVQACTAGVRDCEDVSRESAQRQAGGRPTEAAG